MSQPYGGALEIWRDGEGVAHQPKKEEIRDWGRAVQGLNGMGELAEFAPVGFPVGGRVRDVETGITFERMADVTAQVDQDHSVSGGYKWNALPDCNGVLYAPAVVTDPSTTTRAQRLLNRVAGGTAYFDRTYEVEDTLTVNGGGTKLAGPGGLCLAAGQNVSLMQIAGEAVELSDVTLDVNRAGQTSGNGSALYLTGALLKARRVKFREARGNLILLSESANASFEDCEASGTFGSILIAQNGSHHLNWKRGRIADFHNHGICVTHGGATPSDHAEVDGLFVDGGGNDASAESFPAGVLFNGSTGSVARNCRGHGVRWWDPAAGFYRGTVYMIKGSAEKPARDCQLINSHGWDAGNGAIIDDHSHFCDSIGNHFNDNDHDGLDVNYTRGCKSIGDTANGNGEKGFLFWGAQQALLSNWTATNNNTKRSNGSDSGVVIMRNPNLMIEGANPQSTGIRVIGGRAFDDQDVQTQQHGVNIRDSSTGITVEGNDFGPHNGSAAVFDDSTGPHLNYIARNPGHRTENSGTASIAIGQTSVDINTGIKGGSANSHGQVVNPQRMAVTPKTRLINAAGDPVAHWVQVVDHNSIAINIAEAVFNTNGVEIAPYFHWEAARARALD